VYLPSDSGELALAAYATTDPSVPDIAVTLEGVDPHDLAGDAPPAVVMRTATPMLIPQVTPEVIARLGDSDYARRLVGAVDVRSLLIVPLPTPAGPIGVIAFAMRGTERAYEPEDTALAAEIASRVAPAVENALRFEQQSATAEALQRSLLPTVLE